MLSRVYVLIYLNKQWLPCGLLEHQVDGRRSSSIFRYGKKYLSHPEAIAIDPVQLPLQDRSFETPEGFAIFNGIRDAGPDKWGRYLLDKKFSRSLNELEYIAATSEDRVGALAFIPSLEELGPQQYQASGKFETSPTLERLEIKDCAKAVEDAITAEESKILQQYLSYGPSLGGARPKATVLWKNKNYLAKFSLSLDSKNEPRIEYATLSLAKKCGLQVPKIELIEIGKRSVFLTERFDRDKIHRIPFVSGLTLTGIHESDFSSWSYFALADALLKFSEQPEKDLKELFARLVFNIAVYNNDDHPRNFGFLASGKFWNLSPLYDVSPAVLHSSTYNLAMTLGSEGRRATYQNALSLCPRFHLSIGQARRIIARTREVVSNWKKHFSNLGVSKAEIKMLENSFIEKP